MALPKTSNIVSRTATGGLDNTLYVDKVASIVELSVHVCGAIVLRTLVGPKLISTMSPMELIRVGAPLNAFQSSELFLLQQ